MSAAKKATVVLLALIVLTVSVFSARWWKSEVQMPPKMDFSCFLSEEDVAVAMDRLAHLEKLIDGGKNLAILFEAEQVYEDWERIYHGYLMAQLAYYADMEDPSAEEHFRFAEESYTRGQAEWMRVLKKLYESELFAKKIVFQNWSAGDLAELESSDGEVGELNQAQNELLHRYFDLEWDASAWSEEVAELYLEFVSNANRIAALYGYENYYEYASREIYLRDYDAEERKQFRQSVLRKLLPYYARVAQSYRLALSNLSEEEAALLNVLTEDPCLPENEYLNGYLESYSGEMNTAMNALFDREALFCAEKESAYEIAYSEYSDYLQQPFVFLGYGYQQILTLIHELGHYTAYTHYLSGALPYDLGEVHSQGNEWLFLDYLEERIENEAVYEAFLLYRLQNGLLTVVMSTVVDEFEERVYTAAEGGATPMLRNILSDVWEGVEAESGIRLHRSDFDAYVQQVTMESPVYYLSYAVSEIAAMSLYAEAQTNGYEAAQAIYTELCLEADPALSCREALEAAGLPNPLLWDTMAKIGDAYDSLL
ncbi:MAG: hypothetical protein IKD31_00020 [Clostridia bacterium]|nr:hypothetical protein [Clostridia bacterium]